MLMSRCPQPDLNQAPGTALQLSLGCLVFLSIPESQYHLVHAVLHFPFVSLTWAAMPTCATTVLEPTTQFRSVVFKGHSK